MMWFDPRYLIFVGPAIILAIWAQAKVSSTFARYSRVPSRSGYSGADAARAILRGAGLDPSLAGPSSGSSGPTQGVRIEAIPGRLSDHYDPRSRTLRLSQEVYGGTNLAALGVAAHEAGHAVQHAVGYAPMKLRSAFVPVASFGNHAWYLMFIAGMLLSYRGIPWAPTLITVAIIAFTAVVVFQLVTLPVEFNASRRAIALLTSQGIVSQEEAAGAKKVLSAAALTYVAAALQGILTLLYLLSRRR
ncbi:MAG: zinc metallopeptidase [Planctomycetota bacterium]|jgi:Zn-dependent membrane protease YugP